MSKGLWKTRVKKLSLPLAMTIGGWAWYQHVTRSALGPSPSFSHPQSNILGTSDKVANESSLNSTAQPNSDRPTGETPEGSVTTISDAQALIDRGHYEQGASLLEDLIRQEPTNTQAMMELAMVYSLDFKAPSKARPILEKIIDINPQHRAALNELELVYGELGAVADGLSTLQLKSEQNPESFELQYVYGRMLAISDPSSALPYLQQGTNIPDLRGSALNDLALTAIKAGQVQLAIESWTEALKAAELELEQAKAGNKPGIDFLEDRIAATKSDLLKAKANASLQ